MAGIRQHILPRLLLRGFASRLERDEAFTWVYRRGTAPFEANITKVSVEKYFYDGSELSVDDELTKLESDYGSLLGALRVTPHGTEIKDRRAAEFVAHLCVRTKHLRDSFRESSEFLIDKISEHLSDHQNIKRFILNDPNLSDRLLADLVKDLTIPDLYKEMLPDLIRELAPTLLDDSRLDLRVIVDSLMLNIRSTLTVALKDGHIKALATNPVPEPRVEDYERLDWHVLQSHSPIILGDAGCLFEIEGPRPFKTLNEKDDRIKNIFLPISKDRVLVGSQKSVATRDSNFLALNQETARCSREFFVASECSTEADQLQAFVGEKSELISKQELDAIVNEAFSWRAPD